MPRIAVANMALGFLILFFAAAAGALVAWDITDAWLYNKEHVGSWALMLQKSAHGHTNLFGILHICLGLTMPYAACGPKVRLLQTVGLACGSFAMGPLMVIRSWQGPTEKLDLSSAVTGLLLSFALLAIALQAGALVRRLMNAPKA